MDLCDAVVGAKGDCRSHDAVVAADLVATAVARRSIIDTVAYTRNCVTTFEHSNFPLEIGSICQYPTYGLGRWISNHVAVRD